jgi:hypothetical protein
MTELQKAIDLVKAAGFAVIKRELIKTCEAQKTVSDLALFDIKDNPDFIRHIRRDLHMFLGSALDDARVCKISTVDSQAALMSTTYRASLTVIQHDVKVDPILEEMRRSQRVKEIANG